MIKAKDTGRKPCTEEKPLAKLIQRKQKSDLCDIWKIRNTNTKCYIFRQQHSSSYIQRRLDYFFISNFFQESVKKPDVLAAFLTDHSPITFSLSSKSEKTVCRSIITLYVRIIHTLTAWKNISTIENLKNENISDDQGVWKYLKYKKRKISKKNFKEAACSNKI